MENVKRYSGLTVFALALAFGAGAAKADLVFESNFFLDGPLGNPASELAWLQDEVGNHDLVFLGKADELEGLADWEWGAVDSGLNATFNGHTGEVSWDLTGTGFELRYVLLKDGTFSGVYNDVEVSGHLYSLFSVTPLQHLASGWEAIHFDGLEKDISHVTFFGVQSTTTVPEPAILLLLGAGLIGVALLRRRRTDVVARA